MTRRAYKALDKAIDTYNDVVAKLPLDIRAALKCPVDLTRADITGNKLDMVFDCLLSDPVDGDEHQLVERGVMTVSARRATRLMFRLRAEWSNAKVLVQELKLLQASWQDELSVLQEYSVILQASWPTGDDALLHQDVDPLFQCASPRIVGMCAQVHRQIQDGTSKLDKTTRVLSTISDASTRFYRKYPHPLFCYDFDRADRDHERHGQPHAQRAR